MAEKKIRQDGQPVVTLKDMENNAKAMFDAADRKAGIDKKPWWKPRVQLSGKTG